MIETINAMRMMFVEFSIAITPAISVLSTLEGLKLPTPVLTVHRPPLRSHPDRPLRPAIQGSGRIGKLFGPIMADRFVIIGLLGIGGIIVHPGVLATLDPRYGIAYICRTWRYRICCPRRGVPLRNRRRSALCRHGAFWSTADLHRAQRERAMLS
jgi:K+ transporter